MPAKSLMSWNRTQRRWEKMYHGQRFWVTCTELGLPGEKHNKEDSYQAANEWWTKKRAALDSADLSNLKALEAADYPGVPVLRERADYHRRHGEHDAAEVLDAEVISIKSLHPADVPVLDADTSARVEGFQKVTGLDLSTVDPHVLAAAFNRLDPVWADRIKREAATPKDRTVGALAARWLDRLRQKVDDGKLTMHGPADAVYRLAPFLDLIGRDSDPNTLTADMWERFRDRLEGRNRSGEAAPGWVKKQWQGTRDFVVWMYANKHLQELPRNYPTLRLKVVGKSKIVTFTNDELTKLYAAARGQHRLHILLGLNCGFYPWDVSNLSPTNIDLDAATLTHRRTKTMHKTDDAPTTTYRLWPETVALLRVYLTTAGPHALLNADGKPWIRYTPKPDGKVSETDGIRQWWDRVFKRAGVPYRSFRTLRKTGSTGLESDHRWQGIVTYYLANTRTDVTGRYAAPSDALLADALDWLRLHLGIDRLPA